MNILKTATEWSEGEVFSSMFFILFGVAFILFSIGLWQLGKTDIARAYIIPLCVAGSLLVIIGAGLIIGYKTQAAEYEAAYTADPMAFVESEIERADKNLKNYRLIVFTVTPLIIAGGGLLLLLSNNPQWRAICITTIAFLVVILLIDGTAHSRLVMYKAQLLSAEQEQ